MVKINRTISHFYGSNKAQLSWREKSRSVLCDLETQPRQFHWVSNDRFTYLELLRLCLGCQPFRVQCAVCKKEISVAMSQIYLKCVLNIHAILPHCFHCVLCSSTTEILFLLFFLSSRTNVSLLTYCCFFSVSELIGKIYELPETVCNL